jgi:hypothetical protein
MPINIKIKIYIALKAYLGVLMAISPTNIQILFTNYDIITYFLNLASCSEHFISIKHRILATFNINKKKSI